MTNYVLISYLLNNFNSQVTVTYFHVVYWFCRCVATFLIIHYYYSYSLFVISFTFVVIAQMAVYTSLNFTVLKYVDKT